MALTEKDKKHFLDGDMEWFGSPDDREKLWNQLLKDQEDAEKWNSFEDIETADAFEEFWRNRKIVERLKKLENHPDSNVSSLVKEVLGDKK